MVAEFEIKQHLLELSLGEFLDRTNRERPEITGGCVLLSNATLNAAMVLMALKISLKKGKDAGQRRHLRQKIKTISNFQMLLIDAAAKDLQVFDEYRQILKSKARNKQGRLDHALQHATDSLLGACKTLNKCIAYTEAAKALTDPAVLSDLHAGQLIFEAVFAALIALAEGNIKSMPEEAQVKYERWKEDLQNA